MKTIIAPTDFSASSLNAVAYAADLAVDIKVSLLLLHVVELPATSGLTVNEFNWQLVNREDDLAELKQKMLKRTSNCIEIDTLQTTGNIRFELKNACKLIDPFAVIMCTRAPGALERMLFGSTVMFSVKNLHYPIINIPEDTTYKPVSKIALATDLTNVYHIPDEDIKSIARTFNASLDIVYVENEPEPVKTFETEKVLLLNKLEEFDPVFHKIAGDNIDSAIDDFAISHGIDMVILIPHKHSLFYKSKSRQMIFHLPMPAMTLMEA